jgi:hypothetical protein
LRAHASALCADSDSAESAFVADDGVPFQTVVDALDILENVPVTVGSHVAGTEMEKLDITVRL